MFTAVNTWGLLVLTVLLGYGLVEVPRSLWNASRRAWSLNYCYFKAAKLYSDMCEAADTLAEMKEVMQRKKGEEGRGGRERERGERGEALLLTVPRCKLVGQNLNSTTTQATLHSLSWGVGLGGAAC